MGTGWEDEWEEEEMDTTEDGLTEWARWSRALVDMERWGGPEGMGMAMGAVTVARVTREEGVGEEDEVGGKTEEAMEGEVMVLAGIRLGARLGGVGGMGARALEGGGAARVAGAEVEEEDEKEVSEELAGDSGER